MNGIRESKPSMNGVRESGPSMKGVREVKPSMRGVREAKPSMTGVREVDDNLPSVVKPDTISEEEDIFVCKQRFKNLFKTGKYTKEDVKELLLREGFSLDIINKSMPDYMKGNVSQKEISYLCMEKIKRYFKILVNGESKYTVGQVKAMLVNEGYPVSLVNACLVNLLSDQHICY